MNNIFRQILMAKVYDVARHSPLDRAKHLSQKYSNHIYIKREDTQDVFSFKLRGAYNKIAQLSTDEKRNGMICASAGNHGQGVAYSANKLGLKAVVVMPQTTPPIKIQATSRFGAEIILHGDSYSEAEAWAKNLEKKNGLTFVHPFDDPLVIAGQGTIGKELIEDCPNLDAVFVPVGGGGLIAGIATYLKELRPEIKVIGVQPIESNAMARSIEEGKPIVLDDVGIFADGVAVKKVGELTYTLISSLVDDFITVSTDEICSAIKNIYEETRVIMEPAGALAIAGVKKYLSNHRWTDKNIVAIATGANMNFQRMQFVAERALTGDKLEHLYAIKLKEHPGTLLEFCRKVMVGKNISEFNYRFKGRNEAHIFVGVVYQEMTDQVKFSQELTFQNYEYLDLTENDLAKEHIRHMVGGSTHEVQDEIILRFRFPERQNALAEFLTKMGGRWNISLFHYRSHGADFGQVLVGFEVPPKERPAFKEFLSDADYWHKDETQNAAYEIFLNRLE